MCVSSVPFETHLPTVDVSAHYTLQCRIVTKVLHVRLACVPIELLKTVTNKSVRGRIALRRVCLSEHRADPHPLTDSVGEKMPWSKWAFRFRLRPVDDKKNILISILGQGWFKNKQTNIYLFMHPKPLGESVLNVSFWVVVHWLLLFSLK